MKDQNIEILKELPTQIGTKFLLLFMSDEGTLESMPLKIIGKDKFITTEGDTYAKKSIISHEDVYLNCIIALPHAELRALYKETGSNYKDWEFYSELRWEWAGLGSNPSWFSDIKYRLKEKTITIGWVEVPEPIRKEPEVGEAYYLVCLDAFYDTHEYSWNDEDFEKRWLERGLLHHTKENMLMHKNALIKAST